MGLVLGFRLEEGILSGWSRGDGGGKMLPLGGDRLVVVFVGFKSRKTKRDARGVWCR